MEATKYSLEDLLRKVQAMLARADHPNTPPSEADTARNMAEAMMYRYRIDEAMLAQAQPAGLEIKPEWQTIIVCNERSEFKYDYQRLCRMVLQHVGIRGMFVYANHLDPETGTEGVVVACEAVGYESDLRIAQMLYTDCMLAFGKKLEPKYDSNLSQQQNAYIMRSAGMEGWRIAQAIFGKTDKALRPKVRAMFKKEAEARGEDPTVLLGKGNSVKAFREDFARGFAEQMNSRFYQMRMARADADAGGLVLASRNTHVNEAFYTRYPEYRPVDAPIRSTTGDVDPRKGCAKCSKTKSGYCRDHQYLKPRVARMGRYLNQQAMARGRSAAKDVDLGSNGSGHRVAGNRPAGEL